MYLTELDKEEFYHRNCIIFVYVDKLSDYLVKSQIGCQIDGLCVNHVMYVDDICLMAPHQALLLCKN